jgi:phosphoglycerate dehydrogenase-like enzyme
VHDRAELDRRIAEADVLVVSGLWHDDLLEADRRLLPPVGQRRRRALLRDQLQARGIRLASASGVDARAVAEHAIARIPSFREAPSRSARQKSGSISGAA